jgi:hypothetical protein
MTKIIIFVKRALEDDFLFYEVNITKERPPNLSNIVQDTVYTEHNRKKKKIKRKHTLYFMKFIRPYYQIIEIWQHQTESSNRIDQITKHQNHTTSSTKNDDSDEYID